MVKVKICGITNLKDAKTAQEAGADAIGFVFAKSPRRISIKKAALISKALSSSVKKVGVFVDADEKSARKAIKNIGLDAAQFHGDESPAYCGRFKGLAEVVKAIRIKDKSSLKKIRAYDVDAILLDAYDPRAKGGTGRTFKWSLATAAKRFKKPIILSGGLTPENVKQAIRKVKPHAVDVSSGVEISPGRKDAGKIRNFIRNAKRG